MGLRTQRIWPGDHLGAIDARAIVGVEDAHGRPRHYLLDGEWYAAEPRLAPLTAPCGGRAEDHPNDDGTPQPRA